MKTIITIIAASVMLSGCANMYSPRENACAQKYHTQLERGQIGFGAYWTKTQACLDNADEAVPQWAYDKALDLMHAEKRLLVDGATAVLAGAASGALEGVIRRNTGYTGPVQGNRSASERRKFHASNPCPSTGKTSGACPGYHVDHIKPLACGGADKPYNMQWLTAEANLSKGSMGCRY